MLLFELTEGGYIYTRMNNPTTDVFEKRVAALEGGAASLAVSSGHAAQFIALTTILRKGENFITSPFLYGGSHNQFKVTFANFGIEAKFAQDLNPDTFEKLETLKQFMSKLLEIPASIFLIFRHFHHLLLSTDCL
jgi:O-acetylhomoserine/O-acetylserine sulfhydrylase